VVAERAEPITLRFDNTFSYFSKKKASLRTLLVAPDVIQSMTEEEAVGPALAAAAAEDDGAHRSE
jgi:hypothetical protein